MERRSFLTALFGVPAVAVEDTPRNRVATAANTFMDAWRIWANAINAIKPGSLDMAEVSAWEPIMSLIRTVDRKRTAWIRGNQ